MPRIGEKAANARQRKAVARNRLGGLSLALRMAQRGIYFGDGGLGQRDDPAAIGDEIRGAPGAGVADRAASVSATIQLRSAMKSAARQALASLTGAVRMAADGLLATPSTARVLPSIAIPPFHE